MKMYVRFAAMIVTSTIAMFGLMYLNTYAFDHATFSETRTYMALVMGATMAVIMLGFMTHMLGNRRVNVGIVIASVILFSLSLWLVRSQTTVGEVSYMKAMIPHHSIAILTSERAQISDPRVRELADEIIRAQRREIAEMKLLIDDITAHGIQEEQGTEQSVNALLLGPEVPEPDASAAMVPDGFKVEVAMTGLTYPTSVDFDPAGNMYVAEAGYSYGDPSVSPRILRVAADGSIATVADGASLIGPVNDLLWHDGGLYVSHRGRISILEGSGSLRDLVTGLPSDGDHHNNQMTVGPDGRIYFGQGTATNSGVVGLDNFKMGWLKQHRDFHDLPAQDITLHGRTFETADLFDTTEGPVLTSSFHPFGVTAEDGSELAGRVKASGTILRMAADGTDLEVHAWGLRNPYGLLWSRDGTLYATENGFDVRGSRPIANDKEDIYRVRESGWYGWPDFAMGIPVTDPRFKPEGEAQPQFLMTEHPPVEEPWLTFPKHSAIAKLDSAPKGPFGDGQLFVAFFGHMAPMTGQAPDDHGGHRVVRINPTTKAVETFFNAHGHGGHGSQEEQGHDKPDGQGGEPSGTIARMRRVDISAGPRRLLDVRFSPDGQALYVVDFGAMVVMDKPVPVPGTGVIWRILPSDAEASGPPPGLSAPAP